MDALDITASICRKFEGLYLTPYLCPAGVPTIGYGSTHYGNGDEVTLHDIPITKEYAEELLQLTLSRDYLPGVIKASPSLATQSNRLAAMVDFAYNCGVNRYKNSTLRKRIDAEDWVGAKVECMKWNKAGGRTLAGLTKRRALEATLL